MWTVVLGLLFMALVGTYLSHNARVPVSGVRRDVALGEGYKEPFIVRDGLTEFLHWTVDFFVDEYGDIGIMVLESPDSACATSRSRVIHMRLRDYVNDHMRSSTSARKLYFRSDDGYQFLQEIGLRDMVVRAFSHLMPRVSMSLVSFWMGKKGSHTSFHYDSDNVNLLFLCQGRKKVYFATASGEKMLLDRRNQDWLAYANFDMEDGPGLRTLEKQGALISVVLEEGEILNIPRNSWHAVENLEDSVAFTLHFETPYSVVFGLGPQIVSELALRIFRNAGASIGKRRKKDSFSV